MRLLDGVEDAFFGLAPVAKLFESERFAAFVQDTHDDLLAGRDRERADTEGVGFAAEIDLEPTVLRGAAFIDLEVAEDFDTTDESTMDVFGEFVSFSEDAVDAIPDTDVVIARLDMDIAGTSADGKFQDEVDRLGDRRVFGNIRCFDIVVGLVLFFAFDLDGLADLLLGAFAVGLETGEDIVL